jgi:hypothetical protein
MALSNANPENTTRRARINRARKQFLLGMLGLLLLSPCLFSDASADTPALPQQRVDIAPVPMTGRTITLDAQGNLQEALRNASPGDTIELQPGAIYRGPFVLPRKSGQGWIRITTAGAARTLPAAGTHVEATHASAMAILESAEDYVLSAEDGAGYYRLTGLLLRPAPNTFLYNLVLLGNDAEREDDLPHHLIIERSILHGDPREGTRRGIAMNARHMAVIDSRLTDFMEIGADSQAIGGWNGSGPFLIANNYIEGAGENIMFGGAESFIKDLVPSDIEVRGNHFSKPLSWKADHPSYGGRQWSVKNLFELKNARRVLIDGNLFEHNWTQAQNGFAILFTVRTEGGAMPWAVIEDITFTNNVVRHAGNGINLLGMDSGPGPQGQTRRVLIANNLFHDIGGNWGGGRLFQLMEGTQNITIRNNTADQTDSIVVSDGAPHRGFVFENNVVPHNTYGIVGDGTLPGLRSLERHFPGARVNNNVIAGGSRAAYPRDNHFPRSLGASTARVDGTGADMKSLCQAISQAPATFSSVSQCSQE